MLGDLHKLIPNSQTANKMAYDCDVPKIECTNILSTWWNWNEHLPYSPQRYNF